MLVDLAVMIAGNGETISDLATLRDQRELFGASGLDAHGVGDGG